MPKLGEFKQLLSDDSNRVQLYDTVHEYCAQAVNRLGSDEVIHPAKWDAESLGSYLDMIHEATSDLISVVALLGFWSPPSHQRLVALHSRHFTQWIGSEEANRYGRNLEWYPILLQHYSLGLAAVSAGSFEILRGLLESPYPDPRSLQLRIPSLLAVDSAFSESRQLFKILPGRENNRTPLSEHLFGLLESDLEDAVFFGLDYEYVFDRFEVLASLQYSHLNERLHEGRFWAPVGRFGWKFLGRAGTDPLTDVYREASRAKDLWPPIIAGFFDGDFERFEEVVANTSDHLKRLGWH